MIQMGSAGLNSFDIVPWRKETIKATDFLWEKAMYNNLSTPQKIFTVDSLQQDTLTLT